MHRSSIKINGGVLIAEHPVCMLVKNTNMGENLRNAQFFVEMKNCEVLRARDSSGKPAKGRNRAWRGLGTDSPVAFPPAGGWPGSQCDDHVGNRPK
jgi:hypothetical protein